MSPLSSFLPSFPPPLLIPALECAGDPGNLLLVLYGRPFSFPWWGSVFFIFFFFRHLSFDLSGLLGHSVFWSIVRALNIFCFCFHSTSFCLTFPPPFFVSLVVNKPNPPPLSLGFFFFLDWGASSRFYWAS